MLSDWLILQRVLIATLLSGVLGWERESLGKSAGLRTHMLVGMSAALFVSLAEEMLLHFGGDGSSPALGMDPVRALSAIVSGVSFLGAGTIFVSRDKDRVQGLTTAAGILATAAVGTAVGLDRYIVAVGATVILLVVLRLLLSLERTVNLREEPGA